LKAQPAELQKLQPAAAEFVESVLALRPQIAVFDCDGTLWEGDAGADFFYWEIKQGLIPQAVAQWALPRYADYKAGKVDEQTMCGEMVTINAGIAETVVQQAGEEFFSSVVDCRIFPEMQRLTRLLAEAGCEVWAVSSTSEWVIRAGVKRFDISQERVLAVSVEVENGLATDRLIQVPTDEGKAVVLRKHLRRPIDVCFGNTVHDAAMMEMAQTALAISPTRELAAIAQEKGWRVYWSATQGTGNREQGTGRRPEATGQRPQG
jgi:phosphoserine phosphatase